MPSLSLLVLSVLVALCSTFVIAPFVIRLVCLAVGRQLRRSTEDRRSLIYQRVHAEESTYVAKKKADNGDDGWEKIESYATGSAKNGDRAEKDWDGVVGFFHPFWSVSLNLEP